MVSAVSEVMVFRERAKSRSGIELLVDFLITTKSSIIRVIAVVGNLIHEIAVLDYEKEQQSVDKVYHFFVERNGISRSGSQVGTESLISGTGI